MPAQTAVDVADYLPPPASRSCLAWPDEAQSGRHATRYGLYAFASHAEYPEATRIRVFDSLQRIHLSVWLEDGVEIGVGAKSLHVARRATVVTHVVDDCLDTCFHGRNHHVGLLLSPEIAAHLEDPGVASFLASLKRGACQSSSCANARVLRAAHELDAVLRDAASSILLREAKSLELLALIVAAHEPSRPAPGGRIAARLHQARDMLLADLADPPTIEALVRHCGLNCFNLKQGFKALFGCTVHGLYQQERMRRAWSLIETGQMSVSEAGAAVGYTNLSHFGAAFRKAFGLLPGELRRRTGIPLR